MRRYLIFVPMILLCATVAAAQVPQVASLLTAIIAARGAAVGASPVDASTNASTGDDIDGLLLANTFVTSSDPQIVDLPSGTIMAALTSCPDGWQVHVDGDGKALFFEFGSIVDEDGNFQPDGLVYRLPACVKP